MSELFNLNLIDQPVHKSWFYHPLPRSWYRSNTSTKMPLQVQLTEDRGGSRFLLLERFSEVSVVEQVEDETLYGNDLKRFAILGTPCIPIPKELDERSKKMLSMVQKQFWLQHNLFQFASLCYTIIILSVRPDFETKLLVLLMLMLLVSLYVTPQLNLNTSVLVNMSKAKTFMLCLYLLHYYLKTRNAMCSVPLLLMSVMDLKSIYNFMGYTEFQVFMNYYQFDRDDE